MNGEQSWAPFQLVLGLALAITSDACGGSVVFVNAGAKPNGDGQTWNTAFNDLRTALNSSTVGDQLWVMTGTYRPTGPNGDRSIAFEVKSDTSIYGGFNGSESRLEERDPAVNLTILSGDLNGNDIGGPTHPSHQENSHHVVWVSWAGPPAILDGLVITGGNASQGVPDGGGGIVVLASAVEVINCTISNHRGGPGSGARGGAITIPNGGNITLKDSRVFNNFANRGGGIYGNLAGLWITNCDFSNNTAGVFSGSDLERGGAISATSSTIEIDGCSFSGNIAGYTGGAVEFGLFSTGQIEDSQFEFNFAGVSAAGALVVSGATVVGCTFVGNQAASGAGAGALIGSFINCRFLGNTATSQGGGVFAGGQLTMINCVCSGNQAFQGGGIAIQSGTASLTNCTIVGNFASGLGGGTVRATPTIPLSVVNTILWANADSEGGGENAQLRTGASSIAYSCVQGWTGFLGGTTNFGTDPAFLDADGRDDIPGTIDDELRLARKSVAINRGDPLFVPVFPTDPDGIPRVEECITDVGAYETLDVDPLSPDCDANGLQDPCDIANGAADCNLNVVPDQCDLASGTSTDVDDNGILDDCQGVPINNACGSATLIQSGSTAFTILYATTDGPTEPEGCGFVGEAQIENDIWFRYFAPCAGMVTVSLCGANFDARLAAYVGCPSDSGHAVTCDDDYCGAAPQLRFHNGGPTLYRLRIGAAAGSIGSGVMVVFCTPCPGDIANGDGIVDIDDLLIIINHWGFAAPDPGDITGNGIVDIDDLHEVVDGWGPCR